MYERPPASGGDSWYYTVANDDLIFVRQQSDGLEWRATTDGAAVLRHRLRLDDDLDEIFASFPEDPTLEKARRQYSGLRVVRDPFFPCLISFICSARTPVKRIHAIQRRLAHEFGSAVDVDGSTYYAFPRPDQLVAASESKLRELGLGFRAPYVGETTQMVANGDITETSLRRMSYEEINDELQSFPGVGPKIADCVSLFAFGHLQAVPIDTWTQKLIKRYYPDVTAKSYEDTATAFRDRFGEYAGYAQTYLFHYERSRATIGS
jgi:N-glycosylase/DNA lyase